MAQRTAGAVRSARALTLQSAGPPQELDLGSPTTAERRGAARHRQHRSLQIPSKDVQVAAASSLGSHKADLLLSPTRAGAHFWSNVSTKNLAPSAVASPPSVSREPSRERETAESEREAMPQDVTWEAVKAQRARNQQCERALTTSYENLSSRVQRQTQALNSLQASLDHTLASAGKLLTQLRELFQSSSRNLETWTETTVPTLMRDSETHLAALQRAHVSNSISQLATLKARIATARERTTALQRRVETCAQRTAVEEERERGEQRRHKRRVRLLWALLAGIVIAWIAGIVWSGKDPEPSEARFMSSAVERGNLELRDVLRSKGVEWVLDDGRPTWERSRATGVQMERRYGPARGTTELHRTKVSPASALDERIEHMFDTL